MKFVLCYKFHSIKVILVSCILFMKSARSIKFSQQILGDKLLQVFNLNPLLKLLYYPQATAYNNLPFMICCESILKMLWM